MADHTNDSDHSNGSGHDDEHGHGGVGKYIAVFVSLCVLTAISFLVGSNETIMATPAIGWTLMMAVSCAKALLVMLFFMHLIWEANWKYVLTVPASIMSLFLLLALFPDVKFRTQKYTEERWLHAATPQVPVDDDPALQLHGDDEHADDGNAGHEADAGH
jgi:cytochrome c oxidase subunit 4